MLKSLSLTPPLKPGKIKVVGECAGNTEGSWSHMFSCIPGYSYN